MDNKEFDYLENTRDINIYTAGTVEIHTPKHSMLKA
jgi:hypothetical protein